ncbi:MAG: xylan 1,4-beta-xylosidase [Oscillospiraceae bacterium]|nr:xylan 1,4-beta-xylosidase [Oscillospiraceae bacterium]
MAKADNRFEKIYSQGGFTRTMEIWVDKKTGVNYLCTTSGYSGGMTPLLNRDGTPVVTPVGATYKEE